MSKEADEKLRGDYDFSGGVRGKYRHFRDRTRTLKIRHPDGSVTVETVDASIELDPNVRKYFPNSEAVNKALRGLIELIPEEHDKSSAR